MSAESKGPPSHNDDYWKFPKYVRPLLVNAEEYVNNVIKVGFCQRKHRKKTWMKLRMLLDLQFRTV